MTGSSTCSCIVAVNKTGPTNPAAGTPVFTGRCCPNLTEVAMVCLRPSQHAGCFPDTLAGGRQGRRCARSGHEGSGIDPDRDRRRLPAGAGGAAQPAGCLEPRPDDVQCRECAPADEGGGTLILGPAERADVIVDFTNFAGKTLILYNDAPTAFPALDPHYDYYTGAPDRTDIGGIAAIPPGVGPNIRTVMQIDGGGKRRHRARR